MKKILAGLIVVLIAVIATAFAYKPGISAIARAMLNPATYYGPKSVALADAMQSSHDPNMPAASETMKADYVHSIAYDHGHAAITISAARGMGYADGDPMTVDVKTPYMGAFLLVFVPTDTQRGYKLVVYATIDKTKYSATEGAFIISVTANAALAEMQRQFADIQKMQDREASWKPDSVQ